MIKYLCVGRSLTPSADFKKVFLSKISSAAFTEVNNENIRMTVNNFFII